MAESFSSAFCSIISNLIARQFFVSQSKGLQKYNSNLKIDVLMKQELTL